MEKRIMKNEAMKKEAMKEKVIAQKIKGIPNYIFDQYEIIRVGGKTNMFDMEKVLEIAKKMKLNSLVDYINAYGKKGYERILENYSHYFEAKPLEETEGEKVESSTNLQLVYVKKGAPDMEAEIGGVKHDRIYLRENGEVKETIYCRGYNDARRILQQMDFIPFIDGKISPQINYRDVIESKDKKGVKAAIERAEKLSDVVALGQAFGEKGLVSVEASKDISNQKKKKIDSTIILYPETIQESAKMLSLLKPYLEEGTAEYVRYGKHIEVTAESKGIENAIMEDMAAQGWKVDEKKEKVKAEYFDMPLKIRNKIENDIIELIGKKGGLEEKDMEDLIKKYGSNLTKEDIIRKMRLLGADVGPSFLDLEESSKKWTRIPEQEEGNVIMWFEDGKGGIASLVKSGDYGEIRVGGIPGIDSFKILLVRRNLTEEDMINAVERKINEMRREMKSKRVISDKKTNKISLKDAWNNKVLNREEIIRRIGEDPSYARKNWNEIDPATQVQIQLHTEKSFGDVFASKVISTKFETKENSLFIDGKKVIKGWESFSGWYWFATEDTGQKEKGKPVWFGYVQGLENEWGYFSEAQLDSLKPKVWEIKERDLPHAGRRETSSSKLKNNISSNKQIKRYGNIQITQTPNGTFWVSVLPYMTELKDFKSLKDAEEYAKNIMKNNESSKVTSSQSSFFRVKSQETGDVILWFENDEGDMGTLVKGDGNYLINLIVGESGEAKSIEYPISLDISEDADVMADDVRDIITKEIWKMKKEDYDMRNADTMLSDGDSSKKEVRSGKEEKKSDDKPEDKKKGKIIDEILDMQEQLHHDYNDDEFNYTAGELVEKSIDELKKIANKMLKAISDWLNIIKEDKKKEIDFESSLMESLKKIPLNDDKQAENILCDICGEEIEDGWLNIASGATICDGCFRDLNDDEKNKGTWEQFDAR